MANSIQWRKHMYFIFFSLTLVKEICCQVRSSSDDLTFSSYSNRNRRWEIIKERVAKRPGTHASSCDIMFVRLSIMDIISKNFVSDFVLKPSKIVDLG